MDPKKVLVVDDSKLMHKMYEVMLRQYVLVHAMDGEEASQELENHDDVDLVLLDINMPRMGGLEFLDHMGYQDEDKDLPPVIIVSTEGKEEDTQRGLDAGAVAYIKKPFSSVQLTEVISQMPDDVRGGGQA